MRAGGARAGPAARPLDVAYRLTDASALGLDLARTPGGVEAAGVLLRLLLAGPRDVHPPVRARADLVVARVRAQDLLGPDGPTVVDLTAAEDAAEARRAEQAHHASGAAGSAQEPEAVGSAQEAEDVLLRRLRRMARRLGAVSFGTVTDLLDLGRTLAEHHAGGSAGGSAGGPAGGPADGPAGDLGEVVTDALLAALVRGRPDPAAPVVARALALRMDPPAPALPAVASLLPPGRALLGVGTSPVVVGVVGLLGRIGAASQDVLLLPRGPAPQVWAEHMHSAAWAVEITGRTRLAAAAQLDLLRCLDAAGVSGGAYLGGVWNACSAAVQAQVVVDVLPAETYEVLCADLLGVLPR